MKKKAVRVRSLAYTLKKLLKLGYKELRFKEVFNSTIDYLTSVIGAFEYQRSIKDVCKNVGLSTKTFRMKLLKIPYFVLNLKLFVYKLGRVKRISQIYVDRQKSELHISSVDIDLILSYWRSKDSKVKLTISKLAQNLPNLELLSIEGITNLVHSIQDELMLYIKRMVNKKMFFVHKFYNVDMNDLYHDAFLKVIQVLYSLVPNIQSMDYLLNYLRRSAHNHIINMIKMETMEKRKRLVKVDGKDQYDMTIVSENIITPEGKQVSSIEEECIDEAHTTEQIESEIVINQLLDKYKTKKKKYRFLLIVLGRVDEEFTDYLKAKKIARKFEDNYDVQLRIHPAEFNRHISAFLNMRESKVNVFFLSIQQDLALLEDGVNNVYDVPKRAIAG